MSKVKIVDLPDATLPLSGTDLITATSIGTSSSIPFSVLASSTSLLDGAYYGSVFTVGQHLSDVIQQGSFIYGIARTPLNPAIVKLTTSGTVVWTRTLTPTTASNEFDVYLKAVDSSGNVVVTGVQRESITDVLSIWIAKYNSEGVIQWQRFLSYGLTTFISPEIITFDSANNILLCIGEISAIQLPDSSNIVKYSSTGTLLWQTHLAMVSDIIWPVNVKTDSQNNVFVILVENYVTPVLVKYNSSGVLQWSNTISIGGNAGAVNMVINSTDNVIVAVSAQDGTNKSTVIKYSNTGVQVWATDIADSSISSLALINDNIIAISERFAGDSILHKISINSTGSITEVKEIFVGSTMYDPYCTGLSADANYWYFGVSDYDY